MRISVVGPSYPFRGGIAHYMTLLYRELKKTHEVEFFSFKKQYPSWLFPGKTDRDTSELTISDNEIQPLLHSMNTFSWLHVFFQIRKFNPELVIFSWWVAFWAPQFCTISWLVRKFIKSKVLFICHNVVEHEANFLTKILTKLVLKNGDCFIVHSDEDLLNLQRILPKAEIKKSFHPTYEVFKFKNISKEMARGKLGIKGNTILFFGFVRPYKGLKYLINALPMILNDLDITLLVVGEFWKGKEEYLGLIRELKLNGAVKIIDKYVPNEEVGVYFSASDVVVMPYVSGTGSGIAQIAFGFNRPVIATDVGCLSEVIEDGKTGFIINAGNPAALSEAVIRFYKENREGEFIENIKAFNDKFSWKRMRKSIEELCCDQ